MASRGTNPNPPSQVPAELPEGFHTINKTSLQTDPSPSLLSSSPSSGDISCWGSHQGLVIGGSSCCPASPAPSSCPHSALVWFTNRFFKVSLKNQTLPGPCHWKQRCVCGGSGLCPQGGRKDCAALPGLVALPSSAPAPAAIITHTENHCVPSLNYWAGSPFIMVTVFQWNNKIPPGPSCTPEAREHHCALQPWAAPGGLCEHPRGLQGLGCGMVLLFWRDLLLHRAAPGSSPSFQGRKGNLGSNSSTFEQNLRLHPAAKTPGKRFFSLQIKNTSQASPLTKSSLPNVFMLTTNCLIFINVAAATLAWHIWLRVHALKIWNQKVLVPTATTGSNYPGSGNF